MKMRERGLFVKYDDADGERRFLTADLTEKEVEGVKTAVISIKGEDELVFWNRVDEWLKSLQPDSQVLVDVDEENNYWLRNEEGVLLSFEEVSNIVFNV